MGKMNSNIVVLCTLAIGAVYGVGDVVSHHDMTQQIQQTKPSTKNVTTPVETSKTTNPSQYKDGTYTGVGQNGYGSLSVSLTVAQGKITNISITQYQMHYAQSNIDPVLVQQAIQTQGKLIGVVSGATASSDNLRQAVQDALQQAKA